MSKVEPIHRNPNQDAAAYLNLAEAERAPSRLSPEAVDPVQPSTKSQLLGDRREISIGVDFESETVVTRVVDHRSKEVVYQAPSDRIVQLARERQHRRRLRIADPGSNR